MHLPTAVREGFENLRKTPTTRFARIVSIHRPSLADQCRMALVQELILKKESHKGPAWLSALLDCPASLHKGDSQMHTANDIIFQATSSPIDCAMDVRARLAGFLLSLRLVIFKNTQLAMNHVLFPSPRSSSKFPCLSLPSVY